MTCQSDTSYLCFRGVTKCPTQPRLASYQCQVVSSITTFVVWVDKFRRSCLSLRHAKILDIDGGNVR